MTEQKRLVMKGDLSLKTGTLNLIIPASECTTGRVYIAGLNPIELIVEARITKTSPPTCKIYAPTVWPISGTSVVGISIGGLSGTTVTMSVDALGYTCD
jgi:hypothetical protein